jgi:endonuclease I
MIKKYVLLVALCLGFYTYGQEAYYSNVDLTLTGISLKNELATKIIGTHTNFLSYSEAYQVIKLTDKDISNNTNVILFYNGQTVGQNSTIGGGNSTNPEIWNREHTFAQSQGTPNIGTSGPGSDVHNLRACDAGVNNTRASRKFATGTGTNGITGANYYPGDNYKGDVARIIMYMYVRYGSQCLPTNAGVGSSASTPDDMIDLFLSWNAEDPVSDIEAQRNTVLENLPNGQGNRNPFIDNPYLATLIWGGQPAEDLWGIFTTPDTESPSVPANLNAFNPTANSIQLNWTASTDNNSVTSYDIYQDGVNSYSAPTNNFTVTGLNAETNYCFNIVALDQAGNASTQSLQACNTTLTAGANGTDCNVEDFENIGSNQGNYSLRTWNDSNGLTWNATDARTDQSIISKSITVRNGELTAPTISGGIGNLTVSTKRVFGGSTGTFNVLINGSNVGTVGFGNQDEIITTTLSNINIEGNIQVVLDKNGDSNRVAIDNLSWTCYTTLSNSNIDVNKITIYPNPLNNDLLFINSKTNLNISIYTILGKEVFNAKSSKSKNHINLTSLQAGIYLIKLEGNNRISTKKLIIK